MITLTQYDFTQIRLIETKIHLFENKKPSLFDVVCDLGGLLNALESVHEPWEDDFRAEVNALEIIHDSIEDGSISQWEGNYKEDIRNSISKLRKITVSILEEYMNRSDSSISESAIEGDSNWIICPKCNDAWESDSSKAMVICSKCDRAFHNPRTANV